VRTDARMVTLKPKKGLTKREREIVTLVAEGYSNLNIAAQLGISEETVKAHLYGGVFNKTGCRTRTQVAVKFLAEQL
jgi:DNA-binding NarL/FixJ family response regulator